MKFPVITPRYLMETLAGRSTRRPLTTWTRSAATLKTTGIVNATILDSNFHLTPLVQAVPTPQTQTVISPRIDTQIGNNNTLTFRYALWQNSQNNPDVGQFTLPSAAYDNNERYQSFQASDAQVINEKAVTEIRFRYYRDDENQNPANSMPTISVLGAFVGGASNAGTHSYLDECLRASGLHLRDSEQEFPEVRSPVPG